MDYSLFDHVIVEKGEIKTPSLHNKPFIAKLKHISKIPKGESVVFPHIDSCLGIIIPLQGGAHVVAHIGLHDLDSSAEPDPEKVNKVLSLQRQEILDAIGDDVALTVKFFGDSDWNKTQDQNGSSNRGLYELFLNVEEKNEYKRSEEFPYAPDTSNLKADFKPIDVAINKNGEILTETCNRSENKTENDSDDHQESNSLSP